MTASHTRWKKPETASQRRRVFFLPLPIRPRKQRSLPSRTTSSKGASNTGALSLSSKDATERVPPITFMNIKPRFHRPGQGGLLEYTIIRRFSYEKDMCNIIHRVPVSAAVRNNGRGGNSGRVLSQEFSRNQCGQR